MFTLLLFISYSNSNTEHTQLLALAELFSVKPVSLSSDRLKSLSFSGVHSLSSYS